MSYFPGVFITQYHKSRAGYFINHDLLINGTPTIIKLLPNPEINLSFTISLKMYHKNSPILMLSNIKGKGISIAKQKLPFW